MGTQMKRNMASIESKPSKECGMTLVVVLVILVAMTFLGLGSMSDSNMQVALVRNTQFENMAYSAALSEINAQVEIVNDPATLFSPPAILRAVQLDGAPVQLGDAAMPESLPAMLGADIADEITQNLTLALTGTRNEGGSLNNSPITYRLFEYNSVVTLDNTSFGSDQIQGIKYLGAAPQN